MSEPVKMAQQQRLVKIKSLADELALQIPGLLLDHKKLLEELAELRDENKALRMQLSELEQPREVAELREENELLKMQLRDFQQQEMDRLAVRRSQSLQQQREPVARAEIARLNRLVEELTLHNHQLMSRGWVECDEVDH